MLNPQMFQAAAGGQVVSGEMAFGDVAELRKALEAGYGTDVSTLTGGGALRIQSLEKTMMATIQENKHFALFNELARPTPAPPSMSGPSSRLLAAVWVARPTPKPAPFRLLRASTTAASAWSST